jgi:ferric-dicitrate binding protein FerR (iron transport regulator)
MFMRILAAFFALLVLSAFLFAQEEQKAKESEKASQQSAESEKEKKQEEKQEEKVQETGQVARIESIEGDCEVRESEKADWTVASEGATLAKGGFICTGFASKALLKFPANTTVEMGSLTEIKIDEFFASKEKLETKLKMKIGSLKVTVEKGAIRSDFEVSTPNTTTAVKGTKFIIRSSYYGDTVEVQEDSVEVTDRAGTSLTVREGEKTDSNLSANSECGKMDSAGNPLPQGATAEEQKFARENLSFGPASPTEILGGSSPESDRQCQKPDRKTWITPAD